MVSSRELTEARGWGPGGHLPSSVTEALSSSGGTRLPGPGEAEHTVPGAVQEGRRQSMAVHRARPNRQAASCSFKSLLSTSLEGEVLSHWGNRQKCPGPRRVTGAQGPRHDSCGYARHGSGRGAVAANKGVKIPCLRGADIPVGKADKEDASFMGRF